MKKKINFIGLILDLLVFAIGGLVGMIFGVAFWKGMLIGILTIALVASLQSLTALFNAKLKK